MITNSKPIVAFLLPIALVGWIIFYFSYSFWHFAVPVILWAFLFPFVAVELPKREVDYWYYLIGMVGLIAFYDAQRISANEYVTRTVLAEARERIDWLKELEKDPAKFLERPEIKQRVYSTLRTTFRTEETLRAGEHHDCPAGFNDPSGFCETRVKLRELAQRLSKQSVPIVRYETALVEELLAGQTVELGDLQQNILLRRIRLPSIELYKFYRYGRSGRGSIEPLLDDIEGIMLIEKEWLAAYEKKAEVEVNYGKPRWEAVLFSNFWPYFLFAALSLKLARTRFTLATKDTSS